MQRILTILSLTVIFTACSARKEPAPSRLLDNVPDYTSRSGDLIPFLVEEVEKAGGQVDDLGSEGRLQTEWLFRADSGGFQVLLPSQEKEALVSGLTKRFGEPTLQDTYPHLLYRVQSLGVAMMVDLENDPIHLVCLKESSLP